MNGKEVYKYAVTKPVENIKQLLQKSNEKNRRYKIYYSTSI